MPVVLPTWCSKHRVHALQGPRRGRGPNLHLLEPGTTPEGSVSTGIGTDISLATDDSFPVRRRSSLTGSCQCPAWMAFERKG